MPNGPAQKDEPAPVATEDLFRLLYCSRAAGSAVAPDLDAIAAAARRNNSRHDVTGALLYNRGLFAQLLEGPFPAVRLVFERIQSDPRHQDVVLVQAHTAAIRMFGEFPLAVVQAEDAVYADLVLNRALEESGAEGPHNVLLLLERLIRRRSERPLLAV